MTPYWPSVDVKAVQDMLDQAAELGRQAEVVLRFVEYRLQGDPLSVSINFALYVELYGELSSDSSCPSGKPETGTPSRLESSRTE